MFARTIGLCGFKRGMLAAAAALDSAHARRSGVRRRFRHEIRHRDDERDAAPVHQILQGGGREGLRRPHRGADLPGKPARPDPARNRRRAARHHPRLYRPGRFLRRRRSALRRVLDADAVPRRRQCRGDGPRSGHPEGDVRSGGAETHGRHRHLESRRVRLRRQERDHAAGRFQRQETAHQRHRDGTREDGEARRHRHRHAALRSGAGARPGHHRRHDLGPVGVRPRSR